MSNLNTTTAAILKQSTGNALTEIAIVRNGIRPGSGLRQMTPAPAQDTADMGHNLQIQIDQIKQALAIPPPPITDFQVVDANGALIGWIGTQDVGNVSFVGAWFKDIYIGGIDAAHAVITANDSGVVINGASITLNLNGVTTVISNGHAPSDADVESLTSIDNATGDYSYVNPFEFQSDHQVSPGVYTNCANFGQTGGDGLWQILSSDHLTRMTANVSPGGGARINMVDVFGDAAIYSAARTQAPTINALTSLEFNGTPGISLSTSFGTSLSVSTGTAVTSVTGTGVSSTTGTFVTGVTLNLTGNVFTGGLLTA